MDLQLKGKLSLVSGSTAGIGYAIAQALASEGADVIINGRTQKSVDDAISRLAPKSQGDLNGFAGDLSTQEAAESLVQQYPDLEILVNSLGIFEPSNFEDISDDDWRRFFDINVLSGIRLSRLYLPNMKAHDWGRIIFISSDSGIQIPPGMIHYGMTKAAQIAVSRGLAESVSGTKITVNSVLPGPTKSRGVDDFIEQAAGERDQSFEQFEEEFFELVQPTSLIKRFATPDEVASLVADIASPLSAAVTGAALRVDGGVVKSAF